MIVPMKKLHMIVQNKDIVAALESLRGLGSVHVEHQELPASERIEEHRRDIEDLKGAIRVLQAAKAGENGDGREAADWRGTVKTILELSEEAETRREEIAKRQVKIGQWELWGNFDPEKVDELSARGVYLQLCAVPKDKRGEAPEGVILETVFSSSGIDRCVAISKETVDLPFESIKLPAASLEKMRAQQKKDGERIDGIEREIADHQGYLRSLETALAAQKDALRFEEAAQGMRAEEVLAVLKGFCPADACQDIEAKAKKEHWGILFEEPADDDKVPTLIRNPKWVSLIEPVFKFIDIAPGYREYDISLFFLLFFSLFVGMLIGDAGYGMLFIAAVAWVHFKSGKKMQDPVPLYLAYVLSGCVVAWGVLTGTFFGQQWLAQTSLQPVLPWLKENANIQLFCFTLGAIHLSVAHIWRTIQKFPSVSFLSDVGWLALLWGMFAMSRTLILGAALSPAAVNLLIGGAVLVVFFTRPNWNPLKAVGPGLGDLALNVVNTFTDVVSYIRLFAVGLATVAVADATNSMAAEVGGVWSLLILLVGHGINIVLALMAILVHGLRLNVLEFSGHLNMEWAGFNYVPFKKAKNA
ncbi:MAG: hypothetical protein KAS92_02610 [Candidatus Omnitrophica bacterium]|nr:hypothetical protein [Candidatus Omnitrophota bacterium]